MKIRTDVKAGAQPGACHKVFNRYGKCKKIVCPYPPFKFPCYRTDLVNNSGSFLADVSEEEDLQA